MEAMACGCSCVCSNIGGHAAYAFHEKTALLTEPANPQSIVMNIDRLLIDNQFRISLAQRGRTNIQTFDWDLSARKMVDIFIQE
jgi:glycosyltransferase involved in cell wall biosynthesis